MSNIYAKRATNPTRPGLVDEAGPQRQKRKNKKLKPMITDYLSIINKKWKKLPKKKKIQYITGAVLVLAVVLGLSFYFFQGRSAEADWFDDGWHYRRKLTFNNASSTENLANFPVLVSLNSSRIDYANTQNSGQDIRFTDPNGVILKYEIEKWDEAATSTVWVKIPQIDAQSTIDYIYMYYGNPDASDAQDAENVWDSNFKIVQHLQESSTSSSAYIDSTSNNYDGTATSSFASENLDAVGKIDGANDFDGTDDWIDIGASYNGVKTVELWIKADNTTKDIIDLNGSAYVSVSSGNATTTGFTSPTIYVNGIATTTIDTNWRYVVVTTDTGLNASDLDIGRREGATYFDGIMDEVRISSSARSAEWIEAQYLSMTDTYITYGAEENQEGAIVVWHFNEGSGSTAYDGSNYDNDLTISGASWITGKFGNGLSFDGTDDVATTSDSSTLSPTSSFSITAWIKRDASSNIDIIANKWNNSSASYRFLIDSSDQLALALENSAAGSTSTSATTITDTDWHHVVAVYNSVTPSVSFYIDGQAESSVTTTGWEVGNTANLLVQLRGASAVFKDADEAYIFGGYNNSDSQFNTNIYKFDPSSPTTNSTDTGHDLPQGLEYAPAVYYSSTNKAYIFGGYWLSGTDATYTDEIVEYSIASGVATSTSIGDLPVQLAGASAALNTTNNLIYIFGGWDNTNSQFNTNIYTFDPASPSSNAVDTTHDLPSGREDAPAVYDSAGAKFYIFGGYQGTTTPTYLTEVVQYNYSSGVATTTSIGALPKQLRGTSATYKDSNEIYIFGGWNNTDEIYNTNIYKFDPSSPSTAVSDTGYDLPTGLKDAPAIHDTSGGKNFIFGGFYGTTTPVYLTNIAKFNPSLSTPVSSITDGSQSFVVGAGEAAADSYNNFFGGDIDELYFYNFTLTSAQVLRNYNAELAAALPIQFGSGTVGTTTAPIAYFRFDTGAGTTGYDDTTNNNDLAISGATWTSSGKFGNALSFDGTNDVATSSNSASTNIQGNLSISAWVKATNFATTTQQWLVHKDSGTAGYAFGFGTSANTMVLKIDGTNYESDATFSLTNSTWHHFGATLSGTSTTFYLDGKALGGVVNGANAPPADASSTMVRIGSDGTNYFSGILDEVRIYNYARTALEMRVDYNQGMAVVLGGGTTAGTSSVAYWRFDENQGGTVYDDSANNNNGTVSASSTMGNWTTGKYGNAIDFDGTNDYIQVSDSTSTSITGDLTISAWIRPDVVSKEQTILGKWDETTANNDRSYRLWLDSSNKLNLSVSTDGSAVVTHTGDTALSASTWYHVEATYDTSTSMDVYLNGKLDAAQKTASVPASIDDNVSNLYMGAKENTSGNIDTKFDGAIDDVRLYNYARSASQVLIDYNGGFAVRLGQ
ncbi:DUF2341 domain-containing protein [Patescibacteria group bacterium]|nr:DUF2341 domain-containing protein [Patescibacteria group bacterium]MBU4162414.1 DUF2341 domain-containing protein [Patescibacteria group bacterium]